MSDPTSTTAIEKLLEHRSWVRQLARALVFGHQDAEDLEQEAWLATLQGPPPHESAPRRWLATVMRRAASRSRRRAVLRDEGEAVAGARPEGASTADVVARAEMQERVARSVLRLAEPYRETLLLRFFEDLPLKDVARRMNVPLETVRTRLRRGLLILRSEFEAREPGAWRLELLPLAAAPAAKGGTAAVLGALLMTKTKVAALVVLAILFGWAGWVSFRDRTPEIPVGPEAGTGQQRAVEKTKTRSALEERAKDPTAGATIRPRSVVERDDETAASSPSSAGPASAAAGSGTAIVGEVLAPDGSPVEGATVFAGDPATHGLLWDEDTMRLNLTVVLSQADVLKATTTAKGTFRFDAVSPSSAFTVAATHPDHGLIAVLRVPVRAGEERSVTLRYEGGLRFFGRVTDQDQRPITFARVEATGYTASGETTKRLPGVQAYPEGNYRLDPLPGVQFQMWARALGYYSAPWQPKDVAPGAREHRVDFTLERAPLLRGRLVLANGAPARSLERLKERFGTSWDSTQFELLASLDDPRKDANFRSLSHDAGTLFPKDDAYEFTPRYKFDKFLSLWIDRDLIGFAELKSPGVAPDIVVDWSKASARKPRGALEIVVRSRADRSLVTEYSVTISGPLAAPMSEQTQWGQEVNSADGRYRFPTLVEGKYEIVVRAAGYDTGKSIGEVKAGSEASEAAVELVPASQSPATASVSGMVRGPGREPINGATVWLVPERAERSGDFRRAQTNAEGAFQFEKLLPDSYLVIAEPPQSSRLAPAWTRAIAPASDAVVVSLAEGVVVQFVPEGTTGPFLFRIVDSAGVAVVDEPRSKLQRWGGMHPMVLAPGRYEIQATCPGFAPARASFVAAEGASVPLKFERELK